MKEKGTISRKQFLTGGATVLLGTVLGKLSGRSYAEELQPTAVSDTDTQVSPVGWEQLPLDILPGACLISDRNSELFGAAVRRENAFLTQYIHVCPGMEILLLDTSEVGVENGWISYDRELRPVDILHSETDLGKGKKRISIIVPAGIYFLRGSGSIWTAQPCAWVRNAALYALNFSLGKPDTSAYTEITALSFIQNERISGSGKYSKDTVNCPSMGDLFFSPIGTDIIVTFRNSNIMPYICTGENYTSLSKKDMFTRHFGFGQSWYHCKTTEVCSSLGAYYETTNGSVMQLTVEELAAAEPHLYIRFPSTVTNTLASAYIRTTGVSKRCRRLFTVVHVTDTHGDADSTHAAFEFADQIGANFIAMTGDFVPFGPYHGFNIIHSLVKNAKTPAVYTVGNHDAVGYSDQKVYDVCYSPIREVLQASDEHPYYFRDFQYGNEVVRAISLYPFSEKGLSRVHGFYSQDQLLWLCDTMASAPDNAHIFILRHFSHHKPVLVENANGMFYDFSDSSTDIDNLWMNMETDPVAEIVDAYKERTTIDAQYSGKLKNGTEVITVEYDFTNRGNSEFVAYFTGHIHADAIGYARGTRTPQPVLCSLCTTGTKGSEDYSSYTRLETHRDYGTDTQIALNVFAFDFANKRILAARVGNGSFKDREKTWMELPY